MDTGNFVLLLTTRESEAVPEQRCACALTTEPCEAAAQGTPDISLDRSSTGGHALPPSPSAARSRNSEPIEKLRRGQPAALEPWTKEYHIYRTGSSWSAQISWGKCFVFGELAQINKSINQVNCCDSLVIDRILSHFRMDYPSLYMCKSKRGIKREDGGKVRLLALLFCFVTEFS